MVQQMPNMAPKWTQVEAMLGSRTVLGPPKSEEKTTQQTTSKKHTKGTQKNTNGLRNPTPAAPKSAKTWFASERKASFLFSVAS